MCDFATSLQDLITGFETILNRTARAIPMARISLDAPQSVLTIPTPFTAEDVDTLDMVDLSVSNSTIVIRQAGRYVTNFYGRRTGNAADLTVRIVDSVERNTLPLKVVDTQYPGTVFGDMGTNLTTLEPRNALTPTAAIWSVDDGASTGRQSSGGTNYTEADIMVYWFGD
jgi:hypothetical protein